jgi:hypothetical protein
VSSPAIQARPSRVPHCDIVKLVVALWRYVTTGAVPEGAVLKA